MEFSRFALGWRANDTTARAIRSRANRVLYGTYPIYRVRAVELSVKGRSAVPDAKHDVDLALPLRGNETSPSIVIAMPSRTVISRSP